MKSCYWCRSKKIVRNGRHQNGKQNYKCRDCCRQFVENAHHITDETKDTVRKLLLERLSLRGICRATGVSLPWLTQFLRTEAQKVSLNLNAKVIGQDQEVSVLGLEVDEMWTFVKKKANPVWIWLVMEQKTRQILAYHLGDRSKQSFQILWEKLPEEWKKGHFFIQTIF